MEDATRPMESLVLRSFFYLWCCLCFAAGRCNQKNSVEQQEEWNKASAEAEGIPTFSVSGSAEAITNVGKKQSIAPVFRAVVFFSYHLAA